MVSSIGPTSDPGQGGPLLPSNTARQDIRKSAATSNKYKDLQKDYNEADAELHKLEEELDVLFHCAKLLREQRTAMTIGQLEYPNDASSPQVLDKSEQLIDEYLAVAAKGKAINDMIQELKQECAAARSKCNFIQSKIHSHRHRLKQVFRNDGSLAQGVPDSGFTDGQAIAERIMTAESTGTSVAGVIGAFGAGITYTTLFSAARGRLDLISWAFTCFLIVVIDCTALQVISLPRHAQLARVLRFEYSGTVEARLLTYMLLVGAPLIMGFLLLGISVALVDPQNIHPAPASKLAIQVAGYLPILFIGYFVNSGILVGIFAIIKKFLPDHFRRNLTDVPPKDKKLFGSLLTSLKEKLYFLPGGPGYSIYRRKRLGKKP